MKKSVSRLLVIFSLLLLVLLILVPPVFAYVQTGVIEPEATQQQTPERNKNEIEIIKISPVIVLKGQVNGTQANILFDTGTWPNIIGSHMKPRLSGQIESVGLAEDSYKICDWKNLTVGEFESADTGRICLLDLAPMVESVGIEIDAIAGTPFSLGRVFEIDFENRKFYLQDSPAGSYEIVESLESDEVGRPWIELTIGKSKEKFLVDTGYSGFFNVNQTLAESLKKNGFAKENGEIIGQRYSDGFKSYENVSMLIEKQQIFGYEFNDIPVSVSTDPKSPNRIGIELLRSFKVSMDLQNGKLRLNKNENYSLSNGCTISPK